MSVGRGQILGARSGQEDRLLVRDSGGALLLAVADGMGGHAGGAVASQQAIDAFAAGFAARPADPVRQRLLDGLREGRDALTKAAASGLGSPQMGTTLAATAIVGSRLWLASVGDSSIFLIRAGQITRINADHSMMPVLREQVASGMLLETDLETHPQRNMLRSVLMPDAEPRLIDLPEEPVELVQGDIVVLSSDGLDTLTRAQIAELTQNPDPQAAADAALKAVEAAGRPQQDNTSLVVYRHAAKAGARPAAAKGARRSGVPVWALIGAVAIGAGAAALAVAIQQGAIPGLSPSQREASERTPPPAEDEDRNAPREEADVSPGDDDKGSDTGRAASGPAAAAPAPSGASSQRPAPGHTPAAREKPPEATPSRAPASHPPSPAPDSRPNVNDFELRAQGRIEVAPPVVTVPVPEARGRTGGDTGNIDEGTVPPPVQTIPKADPS